MLDSGEAKLRLTSSSDRMLMGLWVGSSAPQVLELDIQWTDSPCVYVVISAPPVSVPLSFAISAVGMLQPVAAAAAESHNLTCLNR